MSDLPNGRPAADARPPVARRATPATTDSLDIEPHEPLTWTQRAIVVGGVVLTIFALYIAQAVLIPIVLSILLSFLLAPVCERLERWRVPRPVAVVGVILLAVGVVLGVAGITIKGANDLLENLPAYRQNIQAKIDAVQGAQRAGEEGILDRVKEAGETFEELREEFDEGGAAEVPEPGDEDFIGPLPPAGDGTGLRPAEAGDGGFLAAGIRPLVRQTEVIEQRIEALLERGTDEEPIVTAALPPQQSAVQRIFGFLGTYAGTVGTAGLVLVLTLFVLLERDALRDKLLRLASGGQLLVATEALEEAGSRISSYLIAQAIINVTYGTCAALGLLTIGLVATGEPFPNWPLWGLLCTVLRFIPYVGPWVGALFPTAISFGAYESIGVFIAVGGMFVVFELLSNNIMEPLMYGSSTGMSPVSVFLAAIFWGWLWGAIGLVVATPLTVCLVVLGKYVPQLAFFDILLREDPVLDEPTRVYQRLIAGDGEEVGEVCEEFMREHTLVELYDDVLLPALARAEDEVDDGRLSRERADAVYAALAPIIEDMADRHGGTVGGRHTVPTAPTMPGAAGERVKLLHALVVPAADEADELAGQMLGHVLRVQGFTVTVLPHEGLVSEHVEAIRRDRPAAVVLSAVPPASRRQARTLLKRFKTELRPKRTRAILAFWRDDADPAETRKAVEGELAGVTLDVCVDIPNAVEDIRNATASAVLNLADAPPPSTEGAAGEQPAAVAAGPGLPA